MNRPACACTLGGTKCLQIIQLADASPAARVHNQINASLRIDLHENLFSPMHLHISLMRVRMLQTVQNIPAKNHKT